MLVVKTEIRESKINAKGLFTLEPLTKGTIIGILGVGSRVVTEDRYLLEKKQGNTIFAQSAVRWIGRYFLYNLEIGPEEYINHSSDPTMWYHCGVCFAARNIEADEELTVDYRYFNGEGELEPEMDVESGQPIYGLSAKESLLRSAKKLIEIMEDPESRL